MKQRDIICNADGHKTWKGCNQSIDGIKYLLTFNHVFYFII